MNSIVCDILSIKTRLVSEVLIELFVDIILDWLEAVIRVKRVSIARSVNNSDSQFDSFLNDIQLFFVHIYCSVDQFIDTQYFSVFVEIGQKETIN